MQDLRVFLVWVLARAQFIDRWISAVILSTISWYSDFLSTIFYFDTVDDFMLFFAIGTMLNEEWKTLQQSSSMRADCATTDAD